MNPRRVAEIHREMAELHRELAEEMASNDTTSEAEPRKRVKVHPGPLNAPTDLDLARASKMLRRRGISR